ncbi:MAG: hypothetical protein EZS28_029247 [Streblomastix strix]|uniref:Uncharacterized protein n=1 Tax=Streblomastix strix TaxID=222440 RepID=A0A5J4UYG8_9EUKA|nr:MAG: hypothetical protein EZS28_029247 [Streblomastix strix]
MTLSNNRVSKARANDIARYLASNPGHDKERVNQVSRQIGEITRQGVTNYYSRHHWRYCNDLLSSHLLISPLAHQKCVSQPELKWKQGENSLES